MLVFSSNEKNFTERRNRHYVKVLIKAQWNQYDADES